MKVTGIKFYNGAREKVCRLGISYLFLEVLDILLDTEINLLEEKDANGAAVVRQRINEQFVEKADWQHQTTGGID